MKVTRRDFFGGIACTGAAAFAKNASAAALAKKERLLRFGVLSDVHISFYATQHSYQSIQMEKALRWFDAQGVEAVVFPGDMIHSGTVSEIELFADVWNRVFPGNKAADGRKVEMVLVTGNHEIAMWKGRIKDLGEKEWKEKEGLAPRIGEVWERLFGEKYEKVFMKKIKGVTFVGAQYLTCNPPIEDFLKKHADELSAARPFFFVQHAHPAGTCYGRTRVACDGGRATRALAPFPWAVALTGHSHTPLTDDRSVWQGAFTSIGCGSLRNVSLQAPGSCKISSGAGFENYTTPSTAPNGADAMKAMGIANRFNCRQEQFLRVYSDRVLISRREAISGESYGPDLVMPLPAAERRPFDFKMREAKAMAPEFPAGAALTVKRVKGHVRGTPGAKNRKVPVWEITIPRADAVRNARAAAYTLDITTADGSALALGVIDEGFRFPAESARGKACAVCRVACERIPKGGFTVAVRAVSCWGRSSSPIEAKV